MVLAASITLLCLLLRVAHTSRFLRCMRSVRTHGKLRHVCATQESRIKLMVVSPSAPMARATMLLVLTLISGVLSFGEALPQSQYPTVAAKAGEICTVCGTPVSSSDVAIILKGRRLPVMKEMA